MIKLDDIRSLSRMPIRNRYDNTAQDHARLRVRRPINQRLDHSLLSTANLELQHHKRRENSRVAKTVGQRQGVSSLVLLWLIDTLSALIGVVFARLDFYKAGKAL